MALRDHAAGFMLEIMADHEMCTGGCSVCELFGPLTPALIASIRSQMGATRRPSKTPTPVVPISALCRGCSLPFSWSSRTARQVWCSQTCRQRAYRMRRRSA